MKTAEPHGGAANYKPKYIIKHNQLPILTDKKNRQDNKSIKSSSRRGRTRTADHQAGRQHQHPRLAA